MLSTTPYNALQKSSMKNTLLPPPPEKNYELGVTNYDYKLLPASENGAGFFFLQNE
jgi:hypothetical protein